MGSRREEEDPGGSSGSRLTKRIIVKIHGQTGGWSSGTRLVDGGNGVRVVHECSKGAHLGSTSNVLNASTVMAKVKRNPTID